MLRARRELASSRQPSAAVMVGPSKRSSGTASIFNLLVLVRMRSDLGPGVAREKDVTSAVGQIGDEEKRPKILLCHAGS